jgi:hypothetical protein
MGNVKTKENWPSVSLKITNLLLVIQTCYQRISSQAERQINLISSAQPARTLENASNVATINPLQLSKDICDLLITLNIAMMDRDVYIRMDLNPFMVTFLIWQRNACYLVYFPRILATDVTDFLLMRMLILSMIVLLMLLSLLL